ncbi:MAG: hypothetical protein L3J35_00900 [Bacteroidales bacterium]|nr:hypothetical protein [Bacteroidales bacterium]
MKKSFYTLIFLAISLSSVGQKHIGYDFFSCKSNVKTIKFKVLDINFDKKLVAFKHIYELQTELFYDTEGEVINVPVDCKYAGMETYPKAGVVLGIYDLEKGTYLKTFTIYESCYELKNCYNHELSEQQLDSAKQMFKNYDLDITKKPKAILFKKKTKDISEIDINDINFSSSYKNDYDNQITISYLYANEEILFYTEYEDNFAMASSGRVFYRAAYKENGKIIFLNKYFHDNNMEGSRSFEFHDFSPVFNINGNKITLE